MEKTPPPEKSESFSRNFNRRIANLGSPRRTTDAAADAKSEAEKHADREDEAFIEEPLSESETALIFEEVDRFLANSSDARDDGSNLMVEIPSSVLSLCKMVDSMTSRFYSTKIPAKLGSDPDLDSSFFEALNRISKVAIKLSEFPSTTASIPSLNRTTTSLQRAMSLLDEEFNALLKECKHRESDSKFDKKALKQSSFKSSNESTDQHHSAVPESSEPDSTKEEEFPSFSLETISKMKRIAETMICAGYEKECCFSYSLLRQSSFKGILNKYGYENISIDDIQKMQWEILQSEIDKWMAVVNKCSSSLFPGEWKLCDAVFADHPFIAHTLFSGLTRGIVIKLLNFANAVVLTKRSAEKMFKLLDMYETLRDLIPAFNGFPENCRTELISEAEGAKRGIGEAIVGIFYDLESSIKSDNAKIPVPGGAVHPLTRYIMNYLKYACEYKETLEQVLEFLDPKAEENRPAIIDENDDESPRKSQLAYQVTMVMDLLDANLAMRSKLYRDASLRYIFLMNNGRYIFQKIKSSSGITELMGDRWCRKRSTNLRRYHKNYQRETWSKVLQCLNHEGLQVNGKVSKPILKERFKSFNAMFDEIHKTQSSWVVSDDQLQSELRISVSAVMIPAYRSFVGRFKQYFDPGRQSEKYIKYQPDDIEGLIEDLFDGNTASMSRRRT
ncbi:exocyst complex component EXO70B1-like [Cucurbita pepo subsp. pepo]|uniref:exocyst complex component EXO70B1-like n=1 Tax=Cucurbita pepo subsp. pepo TaxID=3664 RepID=UPI000C9D5542|nr:exocyst complex component EXO70B1-like [Cucurbita pepo subsp. pepo]